MGCDIHAYLEYKRKNSEQWCFFGQIDICRDYSLFSLMAGVRAEKDFELFLPKGLPQDVNFRVEAKNRLFICENPNEDEVSPEKAKRFVTHGESQYIGHDKQFVSHPDWHSHSWLDLTEMEAVILRHKEIRMEVIALVAAMKKFVEIGTDARLVFWFDN